MLAIEIDGVSHDYDKDKSQKDKKNWNYWE